MANKTLTYRIGADLGELRRSMEEGTHVTAKQRRELAALEKQQRAHRQSISDLGAGMITFGAAVAAGFAIAGKAAIDWESAFAGVRKTVDGSDEEIAALEGELRQLARTLPSSHKEIAAVAEAAGQLGIKRQDVAAFTRTMIDLGETTNLTAEEAATALAKFANIMGTSASDVDRLGSALVELGNNGASTEKDIIEMALRIASAGKTIGLTESEVLGFASALSSVGIEAEAGGSAISTTMIKIASAVGEGGDALDTFAEVSGMSAEVFAQRFREDAGGAIIAFIQGLGGMQRAGENVFGVLDELGLSDIRVGNALRSASLAADMFTKSISDGSSAWAENSALTEEANKRYETSAAKLQVAGNQIKDALIDIGATVAPIFAGIAQGGSDVARGFQELPGPLQDVVTWVGLAAGGIALFGGAAAIAAPKVLDFRDKMRGLEATGGAMGKGLGKLGLFLSGPWGAAIGIGVGLLGLLTGALGATTRHEQELAEAGKSVAEAIRDQNGAINESVVNTASKVAADTKAGDSQKNLLQLSKDLGLEMGLVTNAILEQGGSLGDLRTRLEGIIQANTEVDTSTGTTIETLNGQGRAAKDLLDGINGLVGGKNDELQKQKDTAQATKEATGAQKEQTKSAEQLKKEAEDLAKALDEVIKQLNAMNDTTLTVREAERSYLEQIKETAEVLKKNGATLDINTEKGMENARALDAQAQEANKFAEAAAREAEQVGGAAAGQAALIASLEASRPKLIETAMSFGMTKQQAQEYADAVLGIPQPDPTLMTTNKDQVLAELQAVKDKINSVPGDKPITVRSLSDEAKRKLEALGFQVRTLPNGQFVIVAHTENARQNLNGLFNSQNNRLLHWQVRITSSVDPGRSGLGGRHDRAYGGIVSFAHGGIRERHAPMIARARPGDVRVWAEPETHRESYIPWAPDRRMRATKILRMTADGFGYHLVPKRQSMARFADGGMTGRWYRQGMPTPVLEMRPDGTRYTRVLIEALNEALRTAKWKIR